MSYWNWVNDIYGFDDAVFQCFKARDEARQLRDIIHKNLGSEYLWDKDGEYKIKLQDEYEEFKDFRKDKSDDSIKGDE